MTVTEQAEPCEPELLPPSTPRVASTSSQAVETSEQAIWKSPAFFRSSPNNFGGLLGSQFDPFADDDGFVPGRGRKRPRHSFQRADWRILDEPLSPQESVDKETWEGECWENTDEDDHKEQIEQEEPAPVINAGSESHAPLSDASEIEKDSNVHESSEKDPYVFVKPSLELTGSMFGRRAPEPNTSAKQRTTMTQDVLGTESHLPTDTPQLRPIPSPGLPIPSPIVSGQSSSQGYFGSAHTVPQTEISQLVPPGPPPQGQYANLGFDDQGSMVHEQYAALENGANGTTEHPGEATISSPSAIVDHHRPETPSLVPPFDLSRIPLRNPEDLEPPHLSSEHDLTEPAVHNAIGVPTDAIPGEDGYNSVASEEDIEGRVGDDAGGQYGVNDETSTHDGLSESGRSGEEVIHEHFHQHEHLLPGLVTDAQAAIDVGASEDEQEDQALETAQIRDDSYETSSIQNSYDHIPPLQGSDDEGEATDEDVVDDDDDDAAASTASAAASDYSSQYDYKDEDEGQVQADESSDKDYESAPLPPSQPSQSEIIILDSDSEEELASDQNAPSQPVVQKNEQDHGSYVVSTSPDFEAEGNRDDWPLSEPTTQPAETEPLLQNDRVDDSDLEEDDSSVDVLAREHDPQSASEQESPFGEENIDKMEDTEAISVDQDHEGPPTSETNPHLTNGLDSEDDEAIRGTGISWHQNQSAIDSQEQEMPSGIVRIYSTLDGASDHVQPQQLHIPSVAGEAEIGHGTLDLDNVSTTEQQKSAAGAQMAHDLSGINIDSGPARAVEQQLPTPDPTQEVVYDETSAFQIERTRFSTHPDTQKSPLGLSISSGSSRDGSSGQNTLTPNDAVHESAPEHNVERDMHDAVTLPASDSIENEAVSSRSTRGKPSEATAVLVSNPPVPNRHAHGLRSKYAYFAPLGTVIDHYNALLDTISIVNETSPVAQAASGPKDHYVTVQLTDPSMAGTLLQAQIFRRYKSALPSLSEGDAILLRDFKVRSYDHTMMLVSVDSSSWAVFDGSSHDAQVNGPPVEYGPEERAYASGLRRWYTEIGADTVADYHMQAMIEKDNMDRESTPTSVMGSDVGSMDSSFRSDATPSARNSRKSRRRSNRRVTIHELRDGRRYTEVGSPSSKESIHELRDGTVYANL